MSFTFGNKTTNNQTQPQFACLEISAEKTKQGKQLLGELLLAQMQCLNSKKWATTAASEACSADFCAELFPPCD